MEGQDSRKEPKLRLGTMINESDIASQFFFLLI
jgi:hypothetical protein